MKIQEVNIKNFKCHDALIITPETVNVVLGKMHHGKSAILEALRFGINGDLPKDAIRVGQNYMSVEILFDTNDTIYKEVSYNTDGSLKKKITLNDKTITEKNLMEWFDEYYSLDKQALKCSMSSEVLSAMDSGEFGDFLMKYVPEEMDFKTICNYVKGIDVEMSDFKDCLKEFLPTDFDFGIDTIKAAYNFFYEERKDSKKRTQLLAGKAIWTPTKDKPIRSDDIVNQELEDLLKEEGARKEIDKQIIAYQNAVVSKRAQDEKIKTLTEEVKSIGAVHVKDTALGENRAQIDECNAKLADVNKTLTTLKNAATLFQNTLENLDKPVCPIHKKLVCSTDKTGIKSEIQSALISHKESIQIQEKELLSIQKKLVELNKEQKALYESQRLFEKKQMLVKQIEDLRSRPVVLPEKPVITTPVDYTAKKITLMNEKKLIAEYQQYLESNEAYEKESNRLAILDAVVKALAPKGCIIHGINKHYIDIFETICNQRAKALGLGYEISMESNNGIQLMFTSKSILTPISFTNASQGERVLLMFLIMDMINQITGLKMLLIDDINHLDKEAIHSFVELLASPEVSRDYDHIFVCGINFKEIMEEFKSKHFKMIQV